MKQVFRNITIVCFSICFLTGTVGIEIFHHICHHSNVQTISINKEETCSKLEEPKIDDCCKVDKDITENHVKGCCGKEIKNNELSFNSEDNCTNLHQTIKLDGNFYPPQNSFPQIIAPLQIDFLLVESPINDLEFYISKIKSQLSDFSSPRDWIIKFLHIVISNYSSGDEPAKLY